VVTPDQRSDPQVANDAWEALLTAHAVVMRQLLADPVWRRLEMREYDVIYTLSKSATPLSLGDLERRVLLSQPALSRLVVRLEDKGLVARGVNPGDKRHLSITLTEEGRRVQRNIGGRHAHAVAAIMSARLSRDEQRHLEALCRAVGSLDPAAAGRVSQPANPAG